MKRFLVPAALAALLCACPTTPGGDGSDASLAGDASQGPQARTKDEFIDQYCAALMPCCSKAGLPADAKTCRLMLAFGASGSTTTYSTANASTCLSQLGALQGDPSLCTGGMNTFECSNAFPSTSATKAPGEACADSHECAPSREGDATCLRGTCAVLIAGKAGDHPCVGTQYANGGSSISWGASDGAAPAEGYLCDRTLGADCDAKTRTCIALADLGQPCTLSYGCVDTAFCNGSSDRCVARAAVGADCPSGADEECVATAECSNTGKCTARPVDPGSLGTPCTGNAACDSNLACTDGTCQHGVRLEPICGEASADASVAGPRDAGAGCDPTGGTCSRQSECCTKYCSGGLCAIPPDAGP
ncbi:MAG TPA: hypothetical protein VGK67_32560 [Myxococcales bacterium]